ncbi:MAG: hypothetical protein HEQ32_09290 [Vampirovibrio sp.]
MVGFSDLLNARLFDEIGAAAQKLDWKLVLEQAPKGLMCHLSDAPIGAKLKAFSNLGDKTQEDQFISAAAHIEKRAEQYTRQAFDAVSTGLLPDAKLDMGLHNRSLQRAFNETLAPHADKLAQKSAYFGPSDDIPAHWVEAGWENGLKAINEGALQVPERISVQPSNWTSRADHLPFQHDVTKGFDDYINKAKAYHQQNGGKNYLITEKDYNKIAEAKFIPTSAVKATEDIEFGPSQELRYKYPDHPTTGVTPNDFLGADEHGTEGAFHRALLPEKLGRIDVEGAKVKSLALPPTVKKVDILNIKDSNIAEVHLPEGVEINRPFIRKSNIQSLTAPKAEMSGLHIDDSKIDRVTAPHAQIQKARITRSTVGELQSLDSGELTSDFRGGNLEDSIIKDSQIKGVFDGDSSFKNSRWQGASEVYDLSDLRDLVFDRQKNIAIQKKVGEHPLSPTAFEGVAPEDAPKSYYSPAWKSDKDLGNKLWPPELKDDPK